MNEEKLISLLNRNIKVKDLKLKLYTCTGILLLVYIQIDSLSFIFLFVDSKKDSTVNGEIWFSTASEAIEVVMAINYAIFFNKGTCTHYIDFITNIMMSFVWINPV